MNLFVDCLCIKKASIYSTYLQLKDKPLCLAGKWLSVTGSVVLIHIFKIIFQVNTAGFSGLRPTVFVFHQPAVMYSVCHHANIILSSCWKLVRKPPFPGQAPWHHNNSVHTDINFFRSSKELTLNCPNHSHPTFSPVISHSLFLSFAQHIRHLWSESVWEKNPRSSQSPSIKLSNWLGRRPGHLGLIAGWRIRIRWQPARGESEALGQFTLCSQHISPCFTAHRGAARRRWGRREEAWIRWM